MIASIRGTLTEKDPTRVVIEAAGVGYEILVPLSTSAKLPHVGAEAALFIHHCVREDDELLFGFATREERVFFAQLVGVSGVGPKIALALLSGVTLTDLSRAIASGDAKRLSAVKGVGKKTAEKICVDLRDKVALPSGRGGDSAAVTDPLVRDAVAALRALGFNEETAVRLVADVLRKNPSVSTVEAVIKLALV